MREQWLKPALMGVGGDVVVETGEELGRLLERLTEAGNPALGFTRALGAIAACSLAAVTLETCDIAPPPPAADDPHALPASHPWSTALAAVFAAGPVAHGFELRLKYEACTRLAAAGATLPFAQLPQALEAGQRSQALRAALLPVLGHRGRWLAERNPDWKYAAATAAATSPGSNEDSAAWQEGNITDRLAYFRRVRAATPATARELLQAGLGEMPAKERVEFVAALSHGLHADDEPLLDSLLKDRSRDVRQHAASLLAGLPAAAHARRLIAWIEPLLTQKKGLLGRNWQIDAPEKADPAWTGAAIDTARPQHEQLGERAWWLYQLARQVPLAWWVTHTGLPPRDLIAWAAKTDWKAALLRGWRERVDSSEPEWIEALLESKDLRPYAPELLAMLPVAQREKHWPTGIDALSKQGLIHDVVASCALGETLSESYSRPFFSSLVDCFGDDRLRSDYALRSHLLDLATLVHPGSLRDTRPIFRGPAETPAMSECAQDFERIVQVRRALHTSHS